MAKSTSDLVMLADHGINLVVDASVKSVNDLTEIINAAGPKGAKVKVVNCNKKSCADLARAAADFPGSVTLDFSE